jgi:hypothetical protein
MLYSTDVLKKQAHTLKVGHICPDISIQGIDDHLAVGRACDLDTPVYQAWSGRCALPCVVLTDVLGLWEEVEQLALVELGLAGNAALKKLFPALVECAVKEGEEDGGVLAEDMARLVIERAEDVDLAQHVVLAGGHRECACPVVKCY